MNRAAIFRTCLIVLTLSSLLVPTVKSQTANYNQLVAQAQADLKAGNAAQALAESQQAISAAPARWEAYVVAGGALQSEQKNDQAADEFSKALECAPAEKQAGIRALLEGAIVAQTAAQAPTQPSSPPQPPPANTNPAPAITAAVAPATPNSGDANSPGLDETMQFILAHSDVSQTVDDDNSLTYQETYGVASPAACTLTWNWLYIISQFDARRDSFTVRLADVDANSVTPNKEAVFLGAAPGHEHFQGSDMDHEDNHVVSLKFSSKNSSVLDARVAAGIAAAKTYTCAPNEKRCAIAQTTSGKGANLWVGDAAMAIRVANALKHAAVLCGAKSSSPF